jgi:cellulose 1,4-beta-cellobiosidase
VTYRTNSWSTGFTADVTITNAGSTAINGWNLQWTFPGNQQITSAWNGVSTQNGQSASVANASYNATIAPNGSASFGFQASYSGTNADPTDFRLGGTACTRV